MKAGDTVRFKDEEFRIVKVVDLGYDKGDDETVYWDANGVYVVEPVES